MDQWLQMKILRHQRKTVALGHEHARLASWVVRLRAEAKSLNKAAEDAKAREQYTEDRLRTLKLEENAIRERLAVLAEEQQARIKQLATLREAYARALDGDPVKNLKKELASMHALVDQWRAKNVQLASQIDVLKQANAKGSKALNDLTDRYETLQEEVDQRRTAKKVKTERRRRLFGHLLYGENA